MIVLDIYTNNITSNEMEKDMLDMVISRRIGIDKEDVSFDKFQSWYKNQDIKTNLYDETQHLYSLYQNIFLILVLSDLSYF